MTKMLENFSSEFKTPEQYIIDITYRIWEERGVGKIRDWYAADGPVRTPHGESADVEKVVSDTLATMHIFPDREIFAEDIIIGDYGDGFYSSHRARSIGTHLGDGPLGPASRRPFTRLAIADCLCRNNQVVEEWVLRDEATVAHQLGLDPVALGAGMGQKRPELYGQGNEAMRQLWVDANGLTIIGDGAIGQKIIDSYDKIWNGKDLKIMDETHDRALRFEGSGSFLDYGRDRAGTYLTTILASIPDGRFEPHHVIVKQEAERPVRVALRWSYCGTLSGQGRYGDPTGCPLALLGISHFELRDGKILNEWMVFDETAIYAQIEAYKTSS